MSPATAKRPRVRLDQLLVERGLVETRTHAQAMLLAGRVRVGTGDSARRDRKPGDLLDPATPIDLVEQDPYVSRGGYKLAAALDAFEIDPGGRVALDIGASTGGFTDVLLQRGAARVYALDVGRGQLAQSLRQDARVVSMERTNARTLTATTLPEPVTVITFDVSFISLGLVLGPAASTLAPGPSDMIALVKPQFEAGRDKVVRGVVRDRAVHSHVLHAVARTARELGIGTRNVIPSPILGPEGNREFLAHMGPGPSCAGLDDVIAKAVDAAWAGAEG